jgi:histidine triad (HIT) family protein
VSDDFYCDEVLSRRTPVEVVVETANVLAFRHTRPHWEAHVVVIPRRHVASLLTMDAADAELIAELLDVVKTVATEMEHSHGGAHIVTNVGKYQESKHLHFHVGAGGTTDG